MKPIMPACFYHPVSALFVDDNQTFLNVIEMSLGQHGGILTCPDAKKAQEIIERSEEDISKDVMRVLDRNESNAISNHLVDVGVSNIPRLIYNKGRSDYIAVVVVDYQMPGMNGIDFCKTIKDKHVLKIMLTAEADQDTAIKAFNDGLIDKFVLKTEDNLYERLFELIKELKQRYFHQLSHTLTDNLGESYKALMKNDQFIKLFQDTFSKSNAVEYYLVDQDGSYLFLDKSGEPTWLIVRSDQEIKQQIAMLEEMEMDKSVIASLKKRKKLLFLPSEQDHESEEPLSSYMFDAEKLDDDYFYSVVEGKITRLIDWEKVKTCSLA